MKAQYKITGMVVTALLSAGAFAEPAMQKTATRIDFNKMIDENNINQRDLQASVTNKMDKTEPAASESVVKDDKKKVLDLIDVEIGVGQDRPVVDRRFNSVGEPRVDAELSLRATRTNKGS